MNDREEALPVFRRRADDERERAEREWKATLDRMMASGLITLEKVEVLQYGTEGLRQQRT
jgi:hypothetical protein